MGDILRDAEPGSRSVGRRYDRMSCVYGMLGDRVERHFVREAVAGLLRPREGEVVLELGFGTGQVLLALAELVGESGWVCGLDASNDMVEEAGRRLRRHGLAGRVGLRTGTATELPYPSRAFDAVFTGFTLELFSDEEISAVLAECARVSKPSGRLCVASLSDRGAPTRPSVWSHDRFPNTVGCRPIDAAAAVRAAGFVVEAVVPTSSGGLPVDLVLARPVRTAGEGSPAQRVPQE